MKEKKKNEIQCCKLQGSRKLDPHFKSNSVPTTVMWPLGLAISRSLMTAIRAASEECGRWDLDHRGLKKMRRKPCKYETSYKGMVVKRGGHLEHLQQGEHLHWQSPESGKVGEINWGSAGGQEACPQLE